MEKKREDEWCKVLEVGNGVKSRTEVERFFPSLVVREMQTRIDREVNMFYFKKMKEFQSGNFCFLCKVKILYHLS